MNTGTAEKVWEATRLNNMVRHKNGRYYARLYAHGKEIWKSLKTSHFGIAEAKLAEVVKEHRENRARKIDQGSAKMTFKDAAAIHLQRVDDRVTLKRRTKAYWHETYTALLKSWPDLPAREIRRITPEVCREWASRYAKGTSGNRYNNTLALLRQIFAVAVEGSVIYANPATALERVSVKGKKLQLPTRAKFVEFIAEMRQGHGRDSKNCADLAEGLAFTGMRIGEAAEVKRQDVDFTNQRLRVSGDPEEATKNGEVRYVPLIPQATALFQRMLGERPGKEPTESLFQVRECQKAINRAAKKVGMARITHHDLRHFFATICIESGVDIPTVSRWLGHKDGGVLAMKTYGHLRDEHSSSQAKKVSFLPTTQV